MNLSTEQLLEIVQYSLVRIDGAWFMALARKLGKETAWEMDVEAWKQFSYVLGKKIRKDMIPNPVWPKSFLEALEILSKIMKIKGLFGKEMDVFVQHTKNLNQGDDCCEVVVSKKTHQKT
jgi:hypothetical protein